MQTKKPKEWTNVRLDVPTYKMFKALAKKRGESLSQVLVYLLSLNK